MSQPFARYIRTEDTKPREKHLTPVDPEPWALLSFLEVAHSQYHAVKELTHLLEDAGFSRLSHEGIDRELKRAKREDVCGYYLKGSSAFLAFHAGVISDPAAVHFRIFGAHSDSPSLRVKPHCKVMSEGFEQLAVEVYGGPILSTWFDRPLSLAGRVMIERNGVLHEALVDLENPVMTIPNLAIHMNRSVNQGVAIEPHKHILPVFTWLDSLERGVRAQSDELTDQSSLINLLAETIEVPTNAIVDFDLFAYETTPPCWIGKEFISAGRIDNLAMAYTGTAALYGSDPAENTIDVVVVTDNEEIGSSTPEGALSSWIRDTFEVIAEGAGMTKTQFLDALDRSLMVSADMTHGVHPNYPEYADPTHRPRLNGGPCIKLAASRSYATDGLSAAAFEMLCLRAGVPLQTFVNRSDLPGGSTIGPLTVRSLPVPTVDVGAAMLAMHSIRELMGAKDLEYMRSAVCELFKGEPLFEAAEVPISE